MRPLARDGAHRDADAGAVDGDVQRAEALDGAPRRRPPPGASSVTSAAREGDAGRPARAASASPAEPGRSRIITRPPPPARTSVPSPRRAPRHRRSPGPRCPRSAWAGVIALRRRRRPAALAPARPGDARVPAMHLDLRGHPLHTRALSITLTPARPTAGSTCTARCSTCASAASSRRRRAAALRHRAPHAARRRGRPGGAGARRHRRTPAGGRVRGLRDHPRRELPRSGRAGAGARGARLDDGFARRLGDEIGGPRGCSHVLTLAHLLGCDRGARGGRDAGGHPRRRRASSSRRRPSGAALVPARRRRRRRRDRRRRARPGPPAHRHPFGRRAGAGAPDGRFAASHEVRASPAIDLGRVRARRRAVAERRRDAATLDAPWARARRVAGEAAPPACRSRAA